MQQQSTEKVFGPWQGSLHDRRSVSQLSRTFLRLAQMLGTYQVVERRQLCEVKQHDSGKDNVITTVSVAACGDSMKGQIVISTTARSATMCKDEVKSATTSAVTAQQDDVAATA